MKTKTFRYVSTITAVLFTTAGLTFANWFERSNTKTCHVTLDSAAKLNNQTVLKAGQYTLKIPENTQSPEVEFYADGRLVAKAQAQVKSEPQKNEYTAIELNSNESTNVITAVDPRGLAEKLVFVNSSTQHGS